MIKLRPYQVQAVKFAENIKNCLLCMKVRSGKTIISLFLIRNLFKEKKIDKTVICCTKTSTQAFKKAFKNIAKIDISIIEDDKSFVEFIKNSEKVCVVKHSMLEKIGFDVNNTKEIFNTLENDYKKILLVIDEAHKVSNTEGNAQQAFHKMKFMFERVVLLTATPYSSCLSQFYGLTCLLNNQLWKSKRDFFNQHIEEVKIMKYGKIVRNEKVSYKNLKLFREKILPFTFFYYPKIKLNFVEHHTRLADYEEYDRLCMGVLSDEEKDTSKS